MLALALLLVLVAPQEECHLDPGVAVGSEEAPPAGDVDDPWPGLAACQGRGLLADLGPDVRLLLRSGDHGALAPTGASLVGVPASDQAPAVLSGLENLVGMAPTRVELKGGVTIELSGDPLVARHVETPAGRFETAWEPNREKVYDGVHRGVESFSEVVARPTRLELWQDRVRVHVAWRAHGKPRRATIDLRAVEVAGTWGVWRRVTPWREDLVDFNSIVVKPDPTDAPPRDADGTTAELVLSERGVYWNICRFAETYAVHRRVRPDGWTRWWFRRGQTPFDQGMDGINALPYIEATFLSPTSAGLGVRDLISAFVDNAKDRRYLLGRIAQENSRGGSEYVHPNDEEHVASFVLTVLDATSGEPIEGAAVRFESRPDPDRRLVTLPDLGHAESTETIAVSDALGRARFGASAMRLGRTDPDTWNAMRYSVLITAEGHHGALLPLSADGGDERSLGTIRLDRTRTLVGRVLGPDGAPPDAQASLVVESWRIDPRRARAFARRAWGVVSEPETRYADVQPDGSFRVEGIAPRADFVSVHAAWTDGEGAGRPVRLRSEGRLEDVTLDLPSRTEWEWSDRAGQAIVTEPSSLSVVRPDAVAFDGRYAIAIEVHLSESRGRSSVTESYGLGADGPLSFEVDLPRGGCNVFVDLLEPPGFAGMIEGFDLGTAARRPKVELEATGLLELVPPEGARSGIAFQVECVGSIILEGRLNPVVPVAYHLVTRPVLVRWTDPSGDARKTTVAIEAGATTRVVLR